MIGLKLSCMLQAPVICVLNEASELNIRCQGWMETREPWCIGAEYHEACFFGLILCSLTAYLWGFEVLWKNAFQSSSYCINKTYAVISRCEPSFISRPSSLCFLFESVKPQFVTACVVWLLAQMLRAKRILWVLQVCRQQGTWSSLAGGGLHRIWALCLSLMVYSCWFCETHYLEVADEAVSSITPKIFPFYPLDFHWTTVWSVRGQSEKTGTRFSRTIKFRVYEVLEKRQGKLGAFYTVNQRLSSWSGIPQDSQHCPSHIYIFLILRTQCLRVKTLIYLPSTKLVHQWDHNYIRRLVCDY